jgi:hypothetical protein
LHQCHVAVTSLTLTNLELNLRLRFSSMGDILKSIYRERDRESKGKSETL